MTEAASQDGKPRSVALAGNRQQQFEGLVRAHSGELYRYAYWLCGQDALAQDLVQETFLRAWRSLDALRDDVAAKAWLATILRREHVFVPRPDLRGGVGQQRAILRETFEHVVGNTDAIERLGQQACKFGAFAPIAAEHDLALLAQRGGDRRGADVRVAVHVAADP